MIITSHSPDLLESENLDTNSILAVQAEGGATRITGKDEAARSALHDRLYTAGELLRMNQLRPSTKPIGESQLKLIDRSR